MAFYFDALTIWQLYIVGFVNGILTVFFDVAYQSYLPIVVERDQLVDGNSKLEITRSAAQILGPGLAGILIGLLRAPFAMILDSVSYLVSAIFVFLIRRPGATGRGARRGGPRPQALDAPGDRGRAALRDRPPLAAQHRRDDRHLELLRQRRSARS